LPVSPHLAHTPKPQLLCVLGSCMRAFLRRDKAVLPWRCTAFCRGILFFAFCSLIVAVGTVAVGAQSRAQAIADTDSNSASLWVTATAGKEQLRFASLGIVQRMRLEVLNQVGDVVYDSEFQEGSLLDWKVDDKNGQPLPDGLYGCVVTVDDISGQSIHPQGVFWLKNGTVQFGSTQSNNAEAAASLEGKESVTVLRGKEGLPITHLAHDAKIARIVSSRGGLNFRVGNFFSGKDVEHMRLTAEGRLGIGVEEPAANLDVAGLIRASEGFQFGDGTVLKMEPSQPLATTVIALTKVPADCQPIRLINTRRLRSFES
jgi:hypothetical protein